MKNPGAGTGRRQMEGMEGYVEIAGTDSAAERTTYQTTSQNNSSTAQLDNSEVPGEGHTEVKLRPPSRASIDWSGSDIAARSVVPIPGVPTGGTEVHVPGVPTGGTRVESQQKAEVSDETCDVGDKCVEVADLIRVLEGLVFDTTRVGSNIEQAASSKDQAPSDPGNLVTTDPGNLVTTDPGCLATPDPGNLVTSDPANPVTSDPGYQATTDPGCLATTDPGCLATTDPGNLVTSDPGKLVTSDPGYQVTPVSPDIRPADEVEETKWPSVKKMVAEIAAGPVVVHRNMSKQTPIRHGLPARRYSLQSTRESSQSTRENLNSTGEHSKASSKRRFSSDVPRGISENRQSSSRASQAVVENMRKKDINETMSEGFVADDLDKTVNDNSESNIVDTESEIVDNSNSESNENFDKFGDDKNSECSADKTNPEDSDQVADDEPADKIPRKFSMNSMLADMM